METKVKTNIRKQLNDNPASYRLEGEKIIETRKGLPSLEMSADFFRGLYERGKITDPIPMSIERLIEFNYDFKRLNEFYGK